MSRQIYQLCTLDVAANGDLLPIWSSSYGDTRKSPLSVLLTYMQNNLSLQNGFNTQHAAPSASGTTVSVATTGNTWLILAPLAAYAAMTLLLPSAPADKTEFLCNTTQAVTTLTISWNGASVIGAPTTLAQYASFRLKFDLVTNTWYKV